MEPAVTSVAKEEDVAERKARLGRRKQLYYPGNNFIPWETTLFPFHNRTEQARRAYSTVTDFARLRGWSTSVPRSTAT